MVIRLWKCYIFFYGWKMWGDIKVFERVVILYSYFFVFMIDFWFLVLVDNGFGDFWDIFVECFYFVIL